MEKKTATYHRFGGDDFTVEYDADAPCRVCGFAVVAASAGGTDVCPWCDMGIHRNGQRWTFKGPWTLNNAIEAAVDLDNGLRFYISHPVMHIPGRYIPGGDIVNSNLPSCFVQNS